MHRVSRSVKQWKIPIPALKAPDAQIARLDAIVELLQAHKNFKQPICGNEKPELLGQWVTTRWESDEKMVDSGRRLRKLFRYRTQSTRDLGQLSDYWRDFTWKSGPVCVRHKGAWWGILRSGLKARKKEDVSYATLLQRQALIQIKLVDGQLAAVVLPGMACPGQ